MTVNGTLRSELESLLDECILRDRMALRAELARGVTDPRRLRGMLARARRSRELLQERARDFPAITIPPELPIAAREEELVDAIGRHRVLVVAGETGSGKSTQLPKLCLRAGLGIAGKIACTQPRRVAALSVSRRIAEEMGVAWGREVGCAIRFQDRTSPRTLIKMMTDGILLNEIQGDPLLSDYEVVIIDEAHERSLNIDFLMGLLRRMEKTRPDLKIILTSATIDTARFSRAFGDAPVFEVSGRMYPVEIRYRPPEDSEGDERFDSVLHASVRCAEDIVRGNARGDILIFYSGERTIRDARELLGRLHLPRTEILPLFGRLSNADQQRIFHPSGNRRIILATNIAETSITIPGIRFVIDTGLARISRYSPHSRTLRLPIEPIAQSSARQRAGRCGRTEGGVCHRLYLEEDLLARPEFPQPEIQRANLASVILRLLDLGIHDIESFPFLDPPDSRSIRGGYNLLRELGALDEQEELTPLGRKLARLPVDPAIGRILFEGARHGCLREILVIAAGLSIQDPRERPADKEAAADQRHREFQHPESDLLTLLNLWKAFETAESDLSRSQLRRWCQERFLSYLRMREWRDIQQQLSEVLKQIGELRLHRSEPDEPSIHRALLAGFLGNVARRIEGNEYAGTHSRRVSLFPGSGLFRRPAPPRKAGAARPPKPPRSPEWILCAEWVETRRLYARSVARIDPKWILEQARHILKTSHGEPTWDPGQGRAIVTEHLTLYGLEVHTRRIGFSRLNPTEAEDMFVRVGLVEEEWETPPGLPFLEHNRAIRRRLEDLQTRTRRLPSVGLEDRIHDFYRSRLEGTGISSLAELRRWLRDDPGADARLHLTEHDFLQEAGRPADTDAFPETVRLEDQEYPLEYRFEPGSEADGATLRIPVQAFGALREGMLDWMLPGQVSEKVEFLLRGLPKEYRRTLFPLAEKREALLRKLRPSPFALTVQLSRLILENWKLEVPQEAWDLRAVPDHLKLRIELADSKGRTMAASRDWKSLETAFFQHHPSTVRPASPGATRPSESRPAGRSPDERHNVAAAKWEKNALTQWSFGDLPESINLGVVAGVPVTVWPGLQAEGDSSVGIRLFRSQSEAEAASRTGVRILGQVALARELAWLNKDLRAVTGLGALLATLSDSATFRRQAYSHLCRRLFQLNPVLPLEEARFETMCQRARESLRGLATRFLDQVTSLLRRRQELLARKDGYPGMHQDVARLLPPDFLDRVPYDRLAHLERYFRAMEIRSQRWRNSPEKDQEKAARLAPYQERLNQALRRHNLPAAQRHALGRAYWLLEEYRVSLFAQELGTAEKVSPKILDQEFDSIPAGD